ncbi:MAG TPA: hypothetical protein VF658_05045 [Pyrinomonadaceae bacterium]|jgi:Tol biopolymer transport system component
MSPRKTFVRHALLSLALALLLNAASVSGQQKPTLVSVNSAGTGSGDARSGDFDRYRITPDGRYVIFYSEATDIVPLGAVRADDIFVRDLQTATTKMVSINAAGTASTGSSGFALISDNGRYVAFTSYAKDIVTNDKNSSGDVFMRDLQTNTTKLVSINAAGTSSGALGSSELIDMSPDGRFVSFASSAQDLTQYPDGNYFGADIYVRDMLNNTTSLITINAAKTASGNVGSYGGSISGDGRYVVFTSGASDLVPNGSRARDIYLRDRQAGTTTRLSNNIAGTTGGNADSGGAIIDRGGRIVVFATLATDLTSLPDGNGISDIYIYDLRTKTRRLITVNVTNNATGSGLYYGFYNHGVQFSISDDALSVAFMSQSNDLVWNDTNSSAGDIFLYDVATLAKSLVSVNLTGTSGPSGGSSHPSISANGRYVAFDSMANDLVNVADEPNGATTDVFVRDIVAGKTYLASINSAGSRTGNGQSFQPFISADGSRLVFHSRASNLIANDFNGFAEDVFAFTLVNGQKPVLLTEANTELAVALDSVTQIRDPFPTVAMQNFSSDRRTRISLFLWQLNLLPGEGVSALTALAEDEQGIPYPVTVEYVGSVAGLEGVKQVLIKLPENIIAPKNLWVKVSLRGLTSNRAFVKIK